MMLSYIDLKHYINSILRYSIDFYINLKNLYIKLLTIKIFIHNESIKLSSRNSKNLLKNVKRILNIIQIIFMIITIMMFRKIRKIILIVIVKINIKLSYMSVLNKIIK